MKQAYCSAVAIIALLSCRHSPSSEQTRVLHAYVFDEKSFLFSMNALQAENQLVYDQFVKAKLNNEDSVRQYYDKAMQIHDASNRVCTYISELKSELKAKASNISEAQADTLSSDQLNNYDDYATSTQLMIGDDPQNVTGKSKDLKKKLQSYCDSVFGLFDQNNVAKIKDKFNPLRCPAIYAEVNEKVISWEYYNFYEVPIVAVLARLSALQNDIRLSEGVAIRELYSEIPTK